jgi:acyl-CoA reductase-like NAD-dependent aldehyde dehydrogenase
MRRLAIYLAALGLSFSPIHVALAAKKAPAMTVLTTTGTGADKVAKLLINGRFVKPKGKKTIAITNPTTLKVLGHIAEANQVDVDNAVGAARKAFPKWRNKLPAERAELLLGIEAQMKANQKLLADTLVAETGKPLPEAMDEVYVAATAFGHYAHLVMNQTGEVAAPISQNQFNYVVREPVGVIAAIVPFNFPLLLTAWKLAPALAAGNTVVLKPPHQNPQSGMLLAQMFKGFPEGVINVVTGAGDTGAMFTKHKDVDRMMFTGSSKVGASIKAEMAKQLKEAHVEGGGLNAAVVFSDADIAHAAKELAFTRGLNAGQVCTSPKRIIVDKAIAEEFTQKLIEHVKQINLGDPAVFGTDMGPLVSAQAKQTVEQQLQQTLAEGGQLLYRHNQVPMKNGKPLPGHFFQPAVVMVKDGMLPTREEIFGPVYTIIVAENEDHAIKLANNSDYALGATAFTTSQRLQYRATHELIGGTVWINRDQDTNNALGFGGPYKSGGGRELGMEGLDAVTWKKTVISSTIESQRSDGFPYTNRPVPGQRKPSVKKTKGDAGN